MKQSIKEAHYYNILDYKIGMKLPDKITVLYNRLSQDDKNKSRGDDSDSIINQKKMLAKFAIENGLTNPVFFTDDGISGTTFERPAFQSALELVEAGRVLNFVVKDMSRFGRDYVRVGFYTENIFPDMNVRFLAINDGVDSAVGENEIIPFKNILNEWYARDTSKKVKAVFRAKGMAGEPVCNNPPYGYKKDPDNPKKHWIVDEPSAKVVRQIFQWCMEGVGVSLIALKLCEMRIERPFVYFANAGLRNSNKPILEPYKWNENTVAQILERREYLGHTVNFKTSRKSYKSKKVLMNDPSEYVVFENTHTAIIDVEVFERVQKIRASGKRRRNHSGRVSLLSGLVYCADCKSRLYLSSGASSTPEKDHYVCPNYRKKYRPKANPCISAHYIRRETLEQSVLNYIQQVTEFVAEYEQVFMQKLQSENTDKHQRELALDKKTLSQSEKRILELDGIIQRLYEDMVAGTLTNERFIKLSQNYEQEQSDLTVKVKHLREQIEEQQEISINVEHFLSRIRQYTRITELSTLMLNELIERVEVHAPDKSSGRRVQNIDVQFNYVGDIGELFLPIALLTEKKQTESAETG